MWVRVRILVDDLFRCVSGNSDIQWCFSQVKGTLEDDATEGMIARNTTHRRDFESNETLCFPADIISCVEFNHDGDMFATGDKGGLVVIFQRDALV